MCCENVVRVVVHVMVLVMVCVVVRVVVHVMVRAIVDVLVLVMMLVVVCVEVLLVIRVMVVVQVVMRVVMRVMVAKPFLSQGGYRPGGAAPIKQEEDPYSPPYLAPHQAPHHYRYDCLNIISLLGIKLQLTTIVFKPKHIHSLSTVNLGHFYSRMQVG